MHKRKNMRCIFLTDNVMVGLHKHSPATPKHYKYALRTLHYIATTASSL